jgi:Competence protein CoiA-like family
MTKLFAAIGADEELRFVGDVPRGAACGCRCLVCHSPLVAKQGDERDWHFAHEGRQERPECLVGAVNLLHRLAVEYLKAGAEIALPRYTQRVHARSSSRNYSEEVSWSAQLTGAPVWLEAKGKEAAVARGRLDNGIDVAIHVSIAEREPNVYPAGAGAGASVVFWCAVPVQSDLRKRIYIEQHFRRCARFIWIHQPDVFGLVDMARRRQQAAADREEAQARHRDQEVAREAGRRWAAATERLRGMQQEQAQSSLPSIAQCEPRPAASSAPALATADYSWAPGRKPNTSFIFYRLEDRQAWVLYSLVDGGHESRRGLSRVRTGI